MNLVDRTVGMTYMYLITINPAGKNITKEITGTFLIFCIYKSDWTCMNDKKIIKEQLLNLLLYDFPFLYIIVNITQL